MKHISTFLTLYAGLLLIGGLALLVAPGEAVAALGYPGGADAFVQLVGAAFLGFGAACWVARRSPLGGIYGRAVVVGNQVFALVGTLLLLAGRPAEAGPGFWLLVATLALGAGLFGVLLVRGPRAGGGV